MKYRTQQTQLEILKEATRIAVEALSRAHSKQKQKQIVDGLKSVLDTLQMEAEAEELQRDFRALHYDFSRFKDLKQGTYTVRVVQVDGCKVIVEPINQDEGVNNAPTVQVYTETASNVDTGIPSW